MPRWMKNINSQSEMYYKSQMLLLTSFKEPHDANLQYSLTIIYQPQVCYQLIWGKDWQTCRGPNEAFQQEAEKRAAKRGLNMLFFSFFLDDCPYEATTLKSRI